MSGATLETGASRPGHRRTGTVLIWIALALGAAAMIFPLYWMLATAIRPRSEVFQPVVSLIPQVLTLENFREVLSAARRGENVPDTPRQDSDQRWSS